MQSVPAATLAWLERELGQWEAEGRVDAVTAAGIRARYAPRRRFSVARLMLLLGGAFVGVGLLWLVAANLEDLSPAVRFGGVVVLWLSAVVGAELLAARREGIRGPAVDGLRLLAALAFGAVVFQAAQSLQVPAYSSHLVGIWSAGALLQAYAVRGLPALLVGLATGTGWWVWTCAERTGSIAGTSLALLLLGAFATAVAVGHGVAGPARFARPWRAAAALLVLGGLFLAALPLDGARLSVDAAGWAGAGTVVVAAGLATVLVADRLSRLEVAAAAAAVALGWLSLLWQPAGSRSAADLSGEALLRALVVIVLFLLVALWCATLGVLRDDPGLTRLATAALVLFAVVQSFAVFEPLLSGAALFLVLGGVLAATGWLAGRGQRTLVASVQELRS